jgi:hypothetical protein
MTDHPSARDRSMNVARDCCSETVCSATFHSMRVLAGGDYA